jgi:hypothetical protein
LNSQVQLQLSLQLSSLSSFLTQLSRTAVDNFIGSLSTTQLRFQRTLSVKDTYVLGTVPERLYKRAAKAHESDDLDGAFVLTLDVQAPTLEEVAAV